MSSITLKSLLHLISIMCSDEAYPHTQIVDELARKICKDLNIPFVR